MPGTDTLVVKKYANRRLYDTERSHYITLAELAAIVRAGRPVRVVDAKSDEDLTRAVLIQVILEEQSRLDMLPVGLLHQIIKVQGTVQQGPLASFLERSYAQYATLGEAWTRQVDQVLGAAAAKDPISQAAQSWMGASAAMAQEFGFPGARGTAPGGAATEPATNAPPTAEPPPAAEPPSAAQAPPAAPREPATAAPSGVAAEVAALKAQMDELMRRLGPQEPRDQGK